MKCDGLGKHIIAFHIGHSPLYEDCTKKQLEDDCCGGVMTLNYCPLCGKDVRKMVARKLGVKSGEN